MAEQTWGDSFAAASMSAMQGYEETLVGPLFTPWGRALVEDLKIAPGESVCDVACGPGSVTRIAAVAAGPEGHLVGCDISEGMLEVGRAKPLLEDAAPIEYLQAPADALPLADESVDVVLCQQGLQYFPDKLAALREMYRVVKPGGRVGIAVWASIEGTPPFKAVAAAIEEVCGMEVATKYRGGPWGFPEDAALASLVREAGFQDARVETRELPLIFTGGAEQLYATLLFSGIVDELAERDPSAVEVLRQRIFDELKPLMADDQVRSHARSNVVRARR